MDVLVIKSQTGGKIKIKGSQDQKQEILQQAHHGLIAGESRDGEKYVRLAGTSLILWWFTF